MKDQYSDAWKLTRLFRVRRSESRKVCKAPKRCGRQALIRQRVRANLEMHHLAGCPFAGFAVERCPGTPSRPESFPFPARLQVVNPAIHPFRKEAEWVGHAE